MNTEKEFRGIADHLVVRMVGEQQADAWWASPNRAFDHRTPEEQWTAGSDAVINYLMSHAMMGGGS